MLKAKVLLVDDNAEFVETLAERLEIRGLETEAVTSGEAALEKVKAKRFDAVVLDIRMPGLDGIETLKCIKELNDEVQIILLSGHATIEIGVEAMKLGALDFMVKPVDDIDALVEKIHVAQAKRVVLEEQHNEEKINDILSRMV